MEKESYVKIAEAEGVPLGEWLFLSDNIKGLSSPLSVSQGYGWGLG